MLRRCAQLHVFAELLALLCAVAVVTCQPPPLPESVNLTRWVQPLPRPTVYKPYCSCGGIDKYTVVMVQTKHQFHPDLPFADVYTYDGQYPGPTFEAEVGRPVHVTWQNWLPEQHILPTQSLAEMDGMEDMPNPPNSSAVVHLHGALIDPSSDGYPMDYRTQGQEVTFEYPNEQLPLTMWYHDHTMTRTRVNVYAGLAGFYLLRDPCEGCLGLPRGEFEVTLMIQDKIIQEDGNLFYPFNWGAFDGDTPVVNGKAYPYLDVKPRAYRFRFLNSCNSRFLRMTLPDGPNIWQIGTDGGFLNEPVRVKVLTLGPAERADVIIDFSGYEGESFILTNSAPVPFTGAAGGDAVFNFRQIMQFRVGTTDKMPPYCLPSLAHVAELPPLPSLSNLPEGLVEQVRDLPLQFLITPGGIAGAMFLLNGHQFHDPPTETPFVDSTEVWNIINVTPFTHPIHLHLVQFRVLQRRPFNATSFVSGQQPQYTGDARLPDPNEQGWKDTVRTNPGEVTTFLVTFPKYTGYFVWHCHMLEHEDHDMMRPLVVMPRDGSDPPPPPGSMDMGDGDMGDGDMGDGDMGEGGMEEHTCSCCGSSSM
jgi:spore coat protein A